MSEDKLAFEKRLSAEGYTHICGCDEVGRGSLAGPVVCAAVIMPLDSLIDGVDDSKKLSPARREELSKIIKERAICFSVARIEPDVIDEINILEATRLCMKRAIEGLPLKADFAMADGNMKLDLRIPYESIVKGDARSYTVGAASIVAKVYRDAYMREISPRYPGYGFEANKGYGTRAHIDAIRRLGPCDQHRRTFIKNI